MPGSSTDGDFAEAFRRASGRLNRESANPRPDQRLSELGRLFQERNFMYGDSYLQFGPVMSAMFPDGLTLQDDLDWNRFALFFMCAVKLHRYAMKFHDGGQKDSLDDLSVYAQMLAYVDERGEE